MSDVFHWENGAEGDLIVFKGAKHKLVGYVVGEPNHETPWKAQSIKGTTARFNTRDEAKEFLNFLLHTEE